MKAIVLIESNYKCTYSVQRNISTALNSVQFLELIHWRFYDLQYWIQLVTYLPCVVLVSEASDICLVVNRIELIDAVAVKTRFYSIIVCYRSQMVVGIAPLPLIGRSALYN